VLVYPGCLAAAGKSDQKDQFAILTFSDPSKEKKKLNTCSKYMDANILNIITEATNIFNNFISISLYVVITKKLVALYSSLPMGNV
jgi:hypothetical protein